MINEKFFELSGQILKWWGGLDTRKGERAALRRHDRPPDFTALLSNTKSAAMNDLFKYLLTCELFEDQYRQDDLQNKVMPILGLLSHVKYDQEPKNKKEDAKGKNPLQISIATAMAQPKNNKPTVSELRFRRLLQTESRAELYPMLFRVMRLMSGSVNIKTNVKDLVRSVFFWNDATRQKWAFDFYRAILKLK